MKVCSKCKEEKELSEFSKDKNSKDSLCYKCKSCEKEYYYENQKKILERTNKYKKDNKEKIKEYRKKYNKNNKEKIIKYRENNKEKLNEYLKKYYKNNKEKHKEYRKEYYENNKEKLNEYNKEYRINNKEKLNEYKTNKKQTNPLFKLRINISGLIYQSIKKKGFTKRSQTYKILGCTYEEFKIHLENQFTKGMNWENQGEWHLDHIYPVSLAKDEEELYKLNHYTNFQPLWAEDNLKKGNKVIEQQLKLL
jgi:hypothetical protein